MTTVKTIGTLLLLIGIGIPSHGQDLRVVEVNFATDIENREAVGVDTSFSSRAETIYCHTVIKGATDSTNIFHIWYYKEEEKARVPLAIASDTWRTWSSKTIPPKWSGTWRVMIEDGNGNMLATKSFTINN